MKKYNHAYSLAFSVENSTHCEGEDVTPKQIRAEIIGRLERLDDSELLEVVGLPYDTYEE